MVDDVPNKEVVFRSIFVRMNFIYGEGILVHDVRYSSIVLFTPCYAWGITYSDDNKGRRDKDDNPKISELYLDAPHNAQLRSIANASPLQRLV